MAKKPTIYASIQPVDDGLIELTKGDDTIRVSPLVLEEHIKLGWKQVQPALDSPVSPETVEPDVPGDTESA